MPHSKRRRVIAAQPNGVRKRPRKELAHKTVDAVAAALPAARFVYLLTFAQSRNAHLTALRAELLQRAIKAAGSPTLLTRPPRLLFGRAAILARSLGTDAETAAEDGIEELGRIIAATKESRSEQPGVDSGLKKTSTARPPSNDADSLTALLFTGDASSSSTDHPNDGSEPTTILPLLASFRRSDFARAGAVAPTTFVLPRGILYATGGQIRPEDDEPLPVGRDPELRRLGVPTRIVQGRVVLEAPNSSANESSNGLAAGSGDGPTNVLANGTGTSPSDEEGYVVCQAGETLGSGQAAILRIFGVEMAEFHVQTRAYWSRDAKRVTLVEGSDGMEVDA